MSRPLSCPGRRFVPCGSTDLVVLARHSARSAFDGYRERWSPSSLVKCRTCGRTRRTRASVVGVPDATAADRE